MNAGSAIRRIVLFAGAGASKAVDAQGYPTTVEFFNRLPATIKENPYFTLVHQFLDKAGGAADVEKILWGLQSLLEFCGDVIQQTGIVGHTFQSKTIRDLFGRAGSTSELRAVCKALRPQLETLIWEINAQVYDYYSPAPTEEQLQSNWIRLLRPLLTSETMEVNVFTTNYDSVIETAAGLLLGSEVDSFLGLKRKGMRSWVDLEQWREDRSPRCHRLTKLHGSIDWKKEGEKLVWGDHLYTRDDSRQAIIYPGFKGHSEQPFFKIFHDYLERCLAEATFVGFIGFAFRDGHITDSIRNNLDPRAHVMVINPDSSVKLPYARSTPTYVRDGFNGATAEALVHAAWDSLKGEEARGGRIRPVE